MDKNGNIAVLDSVNVLIGTNCVLDNVTLFLKSDSRIALMGPSGIGKTTLLRVLAGICPATSGSAELPSEREVSMVFDQDMLYGALSCRQNIELGLPFNHFSKEERSAKAEAWGEFFGCAKFMDQNAGTLSNGQRKRCGLARAMMKEPKLLLLDETFHALDPDLRKTLADKLLELQEEKHFAIVFATHQKEEAQLLKAKILQL